jgi:hypothetical protein
MLAHLGTLRVARGLMPRAGQDRDADWVTSEHVAAIRTETGIA